MHKRTASLNVKSVSVGDLGTIVKKMINGALEDTEQMAKLHRAIYEELYFEKMMEDDNGATHQNSTESCTAKIYGTELFQDIPNCDELEKFAKEESQSNFTQESESFLFGGQGDSCEVENTVNESVEVPVNKNPEEGQTTLQKPEETITITANKKSEKSLDENTQRNDTAFDIWMKEKAKAMRKMRKEELIRRQEELATKQKEFDRRKANHEAYLRSKKLLEMQRKLEETQRRAIRDDWWRVLEQGNLRILANEEIYKAWIQRRNGASPQRYSQLRRFRPQTESSRYCGDVEFDSLLDELDSVLHQKYLRERRYRVRSFYCQPAYYGTAALCMQ